MMRLKQRLASPTLAWMQTADVESVWPLVRSCVTTPWTCQELAKHFHKDLGNGLFVKEGAQPIGFLLYRCDFQAPDHEIVAIGVRPNRRRCGIGAMMMKGFQRHVAGMPSKGIRALVSERAVSAQLLLRAH